MYICLIERWLRGLERHDIPVPVSPRGSQVIYIFSQEIKDVGMGLCIFIITFILPCLCTIPTSLSFSFYFFGQLHCEVNTILIKCNHTVLTVESSWQTHTGSLDPRSLAAYNTGFNLPYGEFGTSSKLIHILGCNMFTTS